MNSAVEAVAEGVLQGQRRALAKAITLLESTLPTDRLQADELLKVLMPHTGKSMRLGVSGSPGVGKSTFIEALGLHVIGRGHRVAVLAVDPSSSVSGGSILGDKTRMEHLSVHEKAYIRPTPASGTLGGVAEKTRESLLACEAAGYDVVIVETVGVGQSETAVAGMTDVFVLLQLPNAGDDLQAIKRGVMELADMVLVNKADIDAAAASRAQAQIAGAWTMVGHHGNAGHRTGANVLQVSALKGEGIEAFWAQMQEGLQAARLDGRHAKRRQDQNQAWMWDVIRAGLLNDFQAHGHVQNALQATRQQVADGVLTASVAARHLLSIFESQGSR